MALYVLSIYAALLLIGGLIGYAKSCSIISLILGSISALGLVSAMLLIKAKNPKGYWLAKGISALLAALFAYRFWLTGSLMPAGMMLSVSLTVLVYLLVRRGK